MRVLTTCLLVVIKLSFVLLITSGISVDAFPTIVSHRLCSKIGAALPQLTTTAATTNKNVRLNVVAALARKHRNDINLDLERSNNSPFNWSKNNTNRSILFSFVVGVSGAALGPFLDSYHSNFEVLHYHRPVSLVLWGTTNKPALVTTWWVPVLFGMAGMIIGWLYVLLDYYNSSREKVSDTSNSGGTVGSVPSPSWPKILLGISLFTFQYWLSGVLYQAGVDRSTMFNILSWIAALGFVSLDGSWVGFVVSAATAIGGPLIECCLLSFFRNGSTFIMSAYGYHYTDPGETGLFPLWIVPVYFLGGPAVGSFSRRVWSVLANVDDNGNYNTSLPGCKICKDTRCVSCPNCDGVGQYVAMGGRSIQCACCKGRGFVICRSCFDFYDQDPNDLVSIRQIMSKMTD
jgi:hypothetical protein